jgi:hypothetical protein
MKVKTIDLYYKKGMSSLDDELMLTFEEGHQTPDLHYIVREGQHVVNYTCIHTGDRVGHSYPTTDFAQVDTRL